MCSVVAARASAAGRLLPAEPHAGREGKAMPLHISDVQLGVWYLFLAIPVLAWMSRPALSDTLEPSKSPFKIACRYEAPKRCNVLYAHNFAQ